MPSSVVCACTQLHPVKHDQAENGLVLLLITHWCDCACCRTADQIWNVYLGGSATDRPFGTAVLDGVDLDIEKYTPYYPDFVVQLNSKHPWLLVSVLLVTRLAFELFSMYSNQTGSRC